MAPDPAEYQQAFAIIAAAGAAKSSALTAIRKAREGDFEAAADALKEADEALHDSHTAQTKMLSQEARGNAVPLNIILIHAQDHLTGALLVRDLADEFIQIHQALQSLSSKA